MQIGEEHQAGTKECDFRVLRLFYFCDQIRARPNGFGRRHNRRARLPVFPVGNGTAGAGPRLNQNFVAVLGERFDHAGDATDTSLVVFNLGGNADYHSVILLSQVTVPIAARQAVLR